MNALVYLLQVSACTAVFYLFYRLLLHQLTFFTINRWYLLATIFLSFIIPVLTIPVNPQQQHIAVVQQAVYINTLQMGPANVTDINMAQIAEPINWMQLLKYFYLITVTGLAFHLIITLIIFYKKIKGKQLSKVGRVNILRGDNKLNNGSFFNYIFLNEQELSAEEMQQIIAHEMLHVKLYHSADRLLVKIAQIILWFNPFIYLYAKSIEENHEFEVDSVMANSTDKKVYADLLLHLSVAGQGLLYHSFSKIPLKKRIIMLFNQPSAKMKKVVYVLILPVVLISCLAFARLKKENSAINKESKNKKALPQKSKNDLSLIKQIKKLYAKNSIPASLSNQIDTTKYRQKLKRTPEQLKGEADFKAWRETEDFKEKEKFAKDVQGKTITVKIEDIVDKDASKTSDIFNAENGRIKGFLVVYNNKKYFLPTHRDTQKQLNNTLQIGDEITLKVHFSTFGRDSLVTILPANIYKDNVKIFQSADVDRVQNYAFSYEANKVRYADGQITHIQKYLNGKWKSAVLEIVNGYKLNLNFKPTAPDFSSIEENDHVVFRFVHEVKTGVKTYQINDWISITTNIKDYGIKNPEFFYKFYEPTVAQNQDREHNFKVTDLNYQAAENMVTALKKDQRNSYISVGKSINTNTLKNEQERIYKFLAAMFPHIEKKDIVFNVDTTLQKGFCTIKTVIKPIT